MSQYANLDKLILTALKSGPQSFTELRFGAVRDECVRLESATGRDEEKILDGRLQALRRAGKIWFTGAKVGQGWALEGDKQ